MSKLIERGSFNYFPMIWGIDLDLVELDAEHVLVVGKVPSVGKDFERRRDPYDFYLSSLRTHFGSKKSVTESPHMAFANAIKDKELMAFVRKFGAITPVAIKRVKKRSEGEVTNWATESLDSLRRERRLYFAILALISELKRGHKRTDPAVARGYVSQIADGVESWPGQWRAEKSWRAKHKLPSIAWYFDSECRDRIRSLASMAEVEHERDESSVTALERAIFPTAFDVGGMLLCELFNAFPTRIQYFNNHPVESLLPGAVQYGIRPCLYLILRHEFLAGGAGGVCRNDRCRRFFLSKRAGQAFCDEDCSRTYRQRQYWSRAGSGIRKKRRNKTAKSLKSGIRE